MRGCRSLGIPAWLEFLLDKDFFADVTQAGFGSKTRVRSGVLYCSELVLPDEARWTTDDDLKSLRTLSRLEFLSLEDTGISGAGLKHISGLPQLRSLSLRNACWFTDAGAENLHDMTSLRELNLAFTQVTEPCVKRLQQALPNCRIEH